MSLICFETGRDIDCETPLYAVTRTYLNSIDALSASVVDKIPEERRLPSPINPVSGGLDIHEAASGEGLSGQYTLGGFSLGKFLFSVSRETAEEFLPKSYQRRVLTN